MSLVSLLWSVNATVALTLALVCVLAWFVERRDLAYPAFCITALATAAATYFELAMMHATTPAEYGSWLQWYHLPIFFTLMGHVLFVRFYLNAGRWWLIGVLFFARLAVLAGNFAVEPNFSFYEIRSLYEFQFLGEPVKVVGEAVGRPWQWLAAGSNLLIFGFVFDASIQCWRRKDRESRLRAFVVALGIGIPMVLNLILNQMIALRLIHVPLCATLWFLGMLIAVSYQLSRKFIASRRDRLQLAQLRGELVQVGRVNTLGQLASGLSHELLQPLAAVQVNADAAQLLLKRPNVDLREITAIIEDIHKDNARASEVLRRMGSLIRKQTVEKETIVLGETIRDVFELLRTEASSRGVVLEAHVPRDLPSASGDRVQISQVLLNLIVNAMQAMDLTDRDKRKVTVQARRGPDGGVETVVTDNGPGVPHDLLEQIFSPLYTTKPGSMGLGLALSRTIIDAHHGRLWAENVSPAGAAFRFTIPVA